ncbi:hypothetical protein RUM43_002224 [Polyplax serrata]|uniref:Transmembrane inner ear expressed protein n=1 Tax=Polyplax serrata TaxID=468196 RepID=A0AAN8PDJ4_POLSC
MLVTEDCKMKNCANISSTEKPLLAVHWLETHAIAGFRVWQLMFLSFAALLALVIILCCCIRYRIPRTKQEIEADYIRKKITKKFQKQLRTIQNSDMDEMDLKRALDRIRAEFKSDTESLAQSEALSEATLSSGNYGSQPGNSDSKKDGLGVSLRDIMEKERRSARSFSSWADIFSKLRGKPKPVDVTE